MKKVLIVSLFSEVLNPNSRVRKIANAFKTKVTVVTPDFSHGEKRYNKKIAFNDELISFDYIHVKPYKKNLSLKRVFSHLVFAYNLKEYLKGIKEKPEIIICLMPTSSAAYVCGKYCNKHKIMFAIDVIDLWPDSLIPIVKKKRFLSVLLFPWKVLTNNAYKLADYISGESIAYASAAHKINPNAPWSYTYLGVNTVQTKKLIEENTLEIRKDDGTINLCYSGSLGNSYDFENILNALKHIHQNGIKYKMYFIGDGDRRSFIDIFSKEHGLNVQITGRLNYSDYLKYISICEIGFNSFKADTLVVHSYKFNDYLACGLFVFNNLKGETAEMIEKYKIGINFNDFDLKEKLMMVCNQWDAYQTYRNNIQLLINEELDSDKIYKKLVADIQKNYNIDN